jgi:hypothetical protein
MEKEAHERDQINWACSAQNEKLLPKASSKSPQKSKEAAGEQIKQMVSPVFEKYYREYGNPRKSS